jgi:ligand-binding sensor domain-containing protein
MKRVSDNKMYNSQFYKILIKDLSMKHRTSFVFSLLFSILFLTSNLFGQIAIGDWRTHLPYDRVIDVSIAGDLVFAATEYSMFTYNTLDNRIQRFDKVSGLSDVGISRIGYSQDQDALLVAYANTNMDLVHSDGSIVNISDIQDKDILGKKTINNITFRDKYAYLSCGFGIVVLDLEREEIHDTYYIGPNGDVIDVLDLTYNEDYFYAATEAGIYYADADAPNLADFNQWKKEELIPYPEEAYSFIISYDGRLYANYYSGEYGGDTVFMFDGTSWGHFDKESADRNYQLFPYKDELYLVNRFNVKIYDQAGNRISTIWSVGGEDFSPLAVDKADDEFLWIGTDGRGLIKNFNTFSGEDIKPNGPTTNNVFDLDAGGKNLWVAPGGRQADWSKVFITDGVFTFFEDTWNVMNRKNTSGLDTITDLVCVAVDQTNPDRAYVGSWDHGLLLFEGEELKEIYTDANSSLGRWIGNPSKILISGVDYDNQNNLWVANTSTADLLSVKKTDGSWRSYNLGGGLSGIDIGELMVDAYNQKWIIKRSDGFVIVFTDNNTIDDPSDDQSKVLNSATGNGNIPGGKVFSFATDKDGEVWVGSDKGVCVFYSPDRIFEPGANFDAQQILVPRNDGSGLADILLETEVVTAIAVDGANRKWIGTERAGVFYLSEDGLEQFAHFTEANSPLLSDNITDIAINAEGEVFIGTARGIISFRGTATDPDAPDSKIYAFPNPVRENYTGLIAIKGVANDASVKITDTYGNIVYETRSEGSQAIWDGYNFDGRRAATGVYLVFVTNDDGSETMVTKILMIR